MTDPTLIDVLALRVRPFGPFGMLPHVPARTIKTGPSAFGRPKPTASH